MDYSLFFEKDDTISYRVLLAFSERPDTLISEVDLIERFDLSSYKLRQTISIINADLADIGIEPATYIDTGEKRVLRGVNVTNDVLQALLLKYLKRSTIFAAFEYRLIYSNYMSKNTYMKDAFISKTTFYNATNQLQSVLDETHFFESSEAKEDQEYIVRLHLFQFYYTVFNGLQSPFVELDELVSKVIDLIKQAFHLAITPSKETKLEILVKVWILRMKNQEFLQAKENSQFNIDDTHIQRLFPIAELLKSETDIVLSQLELNYLLVFLVTQESVDRSDFDMQNFTNDLSKTLTDKLVKQIADSNMFVKDAQVDMENLRKVIMDIHIQFSTFYIEPTTFTSMDQLKFFEQTYPNYHRIISTFISGLEADHVLELSSEDAANLYFSYMFALINTIPSDVLTDKVYVCVDFSQGTLYSQYVINTLDSFRNAHIVIEHVPSDNTDIYLADFKNRKLKAIQQIIWRNPPSPSDWTRLGDSVVAFTQAKSEK